MVLGSKISWFYILDSFMVLRSRLPYGSIGSRLTLSVEDSIEELFGLLLQAVDFGRVLFQVL